MKEEETYFKTSMVCSFQRYKHVWLTEKLKLRNPVHVGLWLGNMHSCTDVPTKLHYILKCMC